MTLAHLSPAHHQESTVPRAALSNKQKREAKRRGHLAKSRANSLVNVTDAPKPKTKAEEAPQTALQRLKSRHALSAKQERGLRLYGALVRAAELAGANGLGSCLGALNRVDGGGGSNAGLTLQAMQTAEWIAESGIRLARARLALGWDSADAELDAARGMVIACDQVAGRGMHPSEIWTETTELAQALSALRIAGDLLARHFDNEARAAA